MRIACPKCDFSPLPETLWQCIPGCGYRWNTFLTHGVCPQCFKFWHDTQCPRCRMWSPHDDWYRNGASSTHTTLEQQEAEKERSLHQVFNLRRTL